MKAPNGPTILALFCVLVFVLCWVAITALTTPTRAIGGGVALAGFTGLFIWFTKTNRHAIARGLIALGATALAAPLAAVQVVTNDMLFSILAEDSDAAGRFLELDAAMQIGWRNAAIGGVVAVILIIIGGVMHRTRHDDRDGAAG